MYAMPVERLSNHSQALAANTPREENRPRGVLYFRAPSGAPYFDTSNIQHLEDHGEASERSETRRRATSNIEKNLRIRVNFIDKAGCGVYTGRPC